MNNIAGHCTASGVTSRPPRTSFWLPPKYSEDGNHEYQATPHATQSHERARKRFSRGRSSDSPKVHRHVIIVQRAGCASTSEAPEWTRYQTLAESTILKVSVSYGVRIPLPVHTITRIVSTTISGMIDSTTTLSTAKLINAYE